MDFSFGFGLGSGAYLLSGYNPLINYDWSTTTTSGLRYLKDVGSTPTYNASMYFGRGAYLNGVDQSITVPINATIQTALRRVNGLVTINETSQTLTNYVISGLGVHKDYYLFTRLLTTAEKDSYTNTPEAFYAMAQADSDCVLNMPMCETDGYARNMKSYSEVVSSNADFNTTTGGWTIWTPGDVVSIADGKLVCTLTSGRYIKLDNVGLASGYVHIEVDYSITAGTKAFSAFSGSPFVGQTYSDNGATAKWLIVSNGTTVVLSVTDGTSDVVKYSKIKITKLYSIYPITNYTTSVRNNAKNLQYGLQTCKFVRDGLGVIQSASDYLMCDGVGYGNTGWIPSVDEDWSIELITENKQIYKSSYFGTDYSGGLHFFKITNGLWYILIGGVSTYIISSTNDYLIFTLVFKRTHYDLYVDGVLVINNKAVTFITGSAFYLGKRGTSSFYSELTQRLFKVHNKALTQAEITANYNSYVAKGLLS